MGGLEGVLTVVACVWGGGLLCRITANRPNVANNRITKTLAQPTVAQK
jgi:hypothetical protein